MARESPVYARVFETARCLAARLRLGKHGGGGHERQMRPRPLRRLALLASLACLSPGAIAQTADNAAPLAAARAFDEAQQHGDRAALERLIAPDFLIVHGSGKVGDRRAFIDGFTAPGARLDPFVITDRLFLRAAADVAIAGGEARISGVEDGRRFAQHFRFADTFVLRAGKWLALYTQVTPLAP